MRNEGDLVTEKVNGYGGEERIESRRRWREGWREGNGREADREEREGGSQEGEP